MAKRPPSEPQRPPIPVSGSKRPKKCVSVERPRRSAAPAVGCVRSNARSNHQPPAPGRSQRGGSSERKANRGGECRITSLQSIGYRIVVSKSGFRTWIRFGICLDPAEPLRLDVTLQVGSMQDRIAVEGSAPTLTSDSATVFWELPRSAQPAPNGAEERSRNCRDPADCRSRLPSPPAHRGPGPLRGGSPSRARRRNQFLSRRQSGWRDRRRGLRVANRRRQAIEAAQVFLHMVNCASAGVDMRLPFIIVERKLGKGRSRRFARTRRLRSFYPSGRTGCEEVTA